MIYVSIDDFYHEIRQLAVPAHASLLMLRVKISHRLLLDGLPGSARKGYAHIISISMSYLFLREQYNLHSHTVRSSGSLSRLKTEAQVDINLVNRVQFSHYFKNNRDSQQS